MLRALLIGPLRFTPVVDSTRRGYAFTGTVALDSRLGQSGPHGEELSS